MENSVHATVPLRVGKKMRKRRELDALVGGGGARSGRLLSASSDEGEPWGRRASRRPRSRPFVRFAAALALCVCVVSAATVLWLFVDVRRQIVSLRMEMDRVSTSSNGVGDAIQWCHTATKDLRNDTNDLNTRLSKLNHDHLELTKRVEQALGELRVVTGELADAPQLAEMPKRLAELQITVANFGSQLEGFDSTLKSVRSQVVTATSGVEDVKNVLHTLEAKSNETVANVTANIKRDEELKQTVVSVNTTLAARVNALQNKIEEINRPVSTTTLAPISTTSSSTTTTTPATAPVPVKPNVTQ